MRCRPLYWLVGLPVLALIAAIALLGELPHMTKDLRERANAALQAAGLDWAQLDFDARDARVSGTATNDREQAAAVDTVRGLYGIRIAEDGTSLIEALRPYVWSLTRKGKSIDVTGFADSDDNRRTVAQAAVAPLRGLSLSQNIKLARGMPQRDQWLLAIEYAAKLSAGLTKGSAKLEDLSLSITGEAATPQAYAGILDMLTNKRPPGLEIALAAIKPPVISPYTWAATWANRTLLLDGYVPDARARQTVLDAADGLFPGATITDKMLLASGEPEQFGSALDQALRSLAQLESGKATLSGVRSDLRGVAVEQETAERVTEAFRSGAPAGVVATQNITFRKARVPIAKPYLWSAEYSGKDLLMEGFVPDDNTKRDLAAFAAGRFKGVRITDRTAIAAGVPAGFAAAAMAGLQNLARLDRGKTRLVDSTIDLSGHVADKATADASKVDFDATVPPAYENSADVTFDPPKVVELPAPKPEPPKVVEAPKPVEKPKVVETPKPIDKPKVALAPKPVEKPKVAETAKPAPLQPAPYLLDAVVENGRIVLTGSVPDREARDTVLSLVASRLPGITVIDNLVMGGGLPASNDDWLHSIDAGLKAVADLGGGHATLKDRALTVSGVTRDKAMPDYVAESLRRALPAGFVSQSQVDYQAPPAPKPYLTTLQYDGLKVAVEGDVPDQASRAKLLAQLKPLFPDRDFDDRTSIRAGAPEGWLQALTQGLAPLSKLDSGQLILRDRSLILSGTTEDEKILAAARQKVTAVLPKGYQGSDQLVYVAPPAPDPKLLAQKQDESKYDVKKLLKQSSPLTAPECQAVLNSVIRGKAFFATARADLDQRAAAALNSVVGLAKRCTRTRVEVSGHTDSDGAPAFNKRLSERRAQSVVDYLKRQGIGADRLLAVGMGQEQPVAPNDTANNKAKNRRIDITVSQANG